MFTPIRYARAAVVVPAHDEADLLPRCLRALLTAAAAASLPVTVVVVLDDCRDASAELAGRFGADVHFVTVDSRNVGVARAAGFHYARTLCDSQAPVWYATTDADSQVDPDWLIRQLAASADVVLGVVRVADWQDVPAPTVRRYLDAYHRGGSDHRHIHGANMGFRADAYWQVGGFRALATGEDVDLVSRFEARGLRIHRDRGLSVTTSARSTGRAPEGFAHYLQELAG